MGIKDIEKHSTAFVLLKHWVKFWHNWIFYRKVEYINREKVPIHEHLIFTPNHQNALMDALAIEMSFRNQFVFLARSDIFQNRFIAKLLYFFKILPVYRIRDGYDSLKKNQEIFAKTMDIIRNKNGFVIFPEGNHAGFRRLRSLKKGFARIAYQAEEAAGYQLDMKIIPVGINYTHYESYRSDLLVIFGEPVDASDFYEPHKINPAVAYNLIKEKLAEKIKPLMIEIDSPYYDLYHGLRKIYGKQACQWLSLNPKRLYERFQAEKIMIDRLKKYETGHTGAMPVFDKQLKDYLENLEIMHFSHEEMTQKPASIFMLGLKILGLVAGFPLFTYGYLNHFIPYFISLYASRKVKDPQFRSSFKYVFSLVLFPLFYVLQTAIVNLIFPHAWFVISYLISLPPSAAFAWNYAKFFKKTRKQFFFIKHRRRKTERYKNAENLWDEIDNRMHVVFGK